MQTLIWALPLFAASRTVGDALVARGQQNSVARIVLVTIGASVGLYFVLIQTRSVNGAAWAFMLSAAMLCTLTLWKGLRMHMAGWGTIWRALLPFVACLAAFQASRNAATPSLAGVGLVCVTAAVTLIPVSLVQWRSWRSGRIRSADQMIVVHRRALATQEDVG
jgi:O-antigen/teichoic acid export membrane protein